MTMTGVSSPHYFLHTIAFFLNNTPLCPLITIWRDIGNHLPAKFLNILHNYYTQRSLPQVSSRKALTIEVCYNDIGFKEELNGMVFHKMSIHNRKEVEEQKC